MIKRLPNILILRAKLIVLACWSLCYHLHFAGAQVRCSTFNCMHSLPGITVLVSTIHQFQNILAEYSIFFEDLDIRITYIAMWSENII